MNNAFGTNKVFFWIKLNGQHVTVTHWPALTSHLFKLKKYPRWVQNKQAARLLPAEPCFDSQDLMKCFSGHMGPKLLAEPLSLRPFNPSR